MDTWILVADGAHARVFELASSEEPLREVACFINPAGRAPGRDSTTDRPPRVNESVGPARHAIEPHTTLREKSADRFARELNDALEHGRNDHRFERLIVVAPPRFLGALHGSFGKPLRDCVVGEVKRNFTAFAPAEIRERLPHRMLTESFPVGRQAG